MDEGSFGAWLDAYGGAWERRDARAFAALFTEDASYFWTPYDEKRGRDGVAAAFAAATSHQDEIDFGYEILSAAGRQGLAHWWCSLLHTGTGRRVHIDGIFFVRLDADGLCDLFREWWHSRES